MVVEPTCERDGEELPEPVHAEPAFRRALGHESEVLGHLATHSPHPGELQPSLDGILYFMLVSVAGWLNHRQAALLAYVREEIRVLGAEKIGSVGKRAGTLESQGRISICGARSTLTATRSRRWGVRLRSTSNS